MIEEIKELFAPGGLLDRTLSAYEYRPGQLQLAEAIATGIDGREQSGETGDGQMVIVAEAETGIGKTFAYLVPALLSGRKVVISTATLTLQDQIMGKDIPLLEKLWGLDLPVACMKGRQNYLCLHRWYQHGGGPQLSMIEDGRLEQLEQWLDTTQTGDRAELDWLGEKSRLWPQISANSSQCLGSKCPERNSCWVNHARRQAAAAQLVVVNHHLYFSDLALRKGGHAELLPLHEVVIFDEGHHLEGVATQFFGQQFSQYQVLDLLSDIRLQAELDLGPELSDRLAGQLTGLKQRIESFALLFPPQVGRFPLQHFIAGIGEEAWGQESQLLALGLQRLHESLVKIVDHGDVWGQLAERAATLRATFLDIADHVGKDNVVHWYDRRERAILLSASPIEIAEELHQYLYSRVLCCVITSATLTAGESFHYIKKRLGLHDEAVTLRFRSPFDYEGRTLLYLPENGFPEPSAANYQPELMERIFALLAASRGRALVLFTSFKSMDAVAAHLSGRLPHRLLVQGMASRSILLEQFREDTDSVLLAVASFWEGIDISGESLSCLIIDKLPFEVPTDPILQARVRSIERSGGNPFFDFQIPRAILALRQGVGRLMRASDDRGVIAILDVRLTSKAYGRAFLKSLPPSPQTRSLSAVTAFFEGSSEN